MLQALILFLEDQTVDVFSNAVLLGENNAIADGAVNGILNKNAVREHELK